MIPTSAKCTSPWSTKPSLLNFKLQFLSKSSESNGPRSLANVRRKLIHADARFRTTAVPRPRFRYQELLDDSRGMDGSTRLLELLPGHDSDIVRCRLKHINVFDCPKYETVSYCWGDGTDQASILCENASLRIPSNLVAALRSFRYPDRSRLIWADAVCIDQSNLSEKEHQIKLMRNIYSKSQRTLIWLSNRKRLQMSWSARLGLALCLVIGRARVRRLQLPYIRFSNFKDETSTPLHPFSTKSYLTLIDVLRDPWFERAWIVQEVAASTNPMIIWDEFELQWADIIYALRFMSRVNFGLAFMPTLQHIAAIENERQQYRRERQSLLGLLQRHQRCLATDARDKIFAFCGLAEQLPKGLRIDYRTDVPAVYQNVARHILHHELNLDLLSQSPTLCSARLPGLPSWMPDWSKSMTEKVSHSWAPAALSLAMKGNSNDQERPRALRFAAAAKTSFQPQFINHGYHLVVRGYAFDTITEMGEVFEGVDLPPPATDLMGVARGWVDFIRTFQQAQRVLLGWESIAKARSKAKYVTGEDILDAYWETISTGDYLISAAIRAEIGVWDKVNRVHNCLRKYRVQFMTLLYSMVLTLWNVMANGPLFKFSIQGHYALYRRLVKTRTGYIGLASSTAKIGDSVVLCKGSNVPLILRQGKDDENSWQLVGDAYIHGIMHGEGFEEGNCGVIIIA